MFVYYRSSRKCAYINAFFCYFVRFVLCFTDPRNYWQNEYWNEKYNIQYAYLFAIKNSKLQYNWRKGCLRNKLSQSVSKEHVGKHLYGSHLWCRIWKKPMKTPSRIAKKTEEPIVWQNIWSNHGTLFGYSLKHKGCK